MVRLPADFSLDRGGRRWDGRFPQCKTCCDARYKLWAVKNREHRRVYHRGWRAKNAEHVRECKRRRYAANPSVRLRNEEWFKAHPEVRKAVKQNRRARERGGGEKITGEQFRALSERFGNKCLCCGATDVRLTADHVTPLSRGGTNTIDNIQPLCSRCNKVKHTRVVDYRSQAA